MRLSGRSLRASPGVLLIAARYTARKISDVTQILSAIQVGDPQASKQLLPLIYDELRKGAAQLITPEPLG